MLIVGNPKVGTALMQENPRLAIELPLKILICQIIWRTQGAYHLGRLKKEGNETVSNCHQLKLESADGKIRLTEMAERSGFNDYSNFVRAFKNIGGVTPTQYIKIE